MTRTSRTLTAFTAVPAITMVVLGLSAFLVSETRPPGTLLPVLVGGLLLALWSTSRLRARPDSLVVAGAVLVALSAGLAALPALDRLLDLFQGEIRTLRELGATAGAQALGAVLCVPVLVDAALTGRAQLMAGRPGLDVGPGAERQHGLQSERGRVHGHAET